MNVFLNPNLLQIIHRDTIPLFIYYYTGNKITNWDVDLKLFGNISFHPGQIFNILSVEILTDEFIVAYDIDRENPFFLHNLDG